MSATAHKLIFSCANTAAVLVALYIAFAANLERPYWAMFSVFIIAKPISGAVRSKAAYRLAGTLAGAAMALLLVPPLAQAPVLLCLATSLWVGLCLYYATLDRTPRSYAFLLAGYTATIVGFSVVNVPQQIFNTAVARVEEIGIGIICGAVAHSVIFPQNVAEQLKRRAASVVRACAQWLYESPPRPDQPVDLSVQQKLAAAVTESHLLYTHVAFETSGARLERPLMQALEERIAILLPRVSGVQRSLEALARLGATPAALARLIPQVSSWARALANRDTHRDRTSGEDNELQQACTAALEPLDGLTGGWPALLEHAAIVELSELTRALADCARLSSLLNTPNPRPPRGLETRSGRARARPLSSDRGLALLSGIAAMSATLLSCVLWIGGSWPQGGVAAEFAAIGSSLFATLDNPAEPIMPAVAGILLALPFAAFYEFALFPKITGFASLALVLSPMLFLLSLMQTFERLEGMALVLAIAFCGALALEPSYHADFAMFLNVNAAEIIGLLIAGMTILMLRTVEPLWNARRLSDAGWRSLVQLVRSPPPDFAHWLIQMLDRLGLIATRLLGSGRDDTGHSETDALRDLRVGINIHALRGPGPDGGTPQRAALDAVLDSVAGTFEEKLRGHSDRTSADLMRRIDAAIAASCAQPPSATRRTLLAALTGLRLDLLPTQAPPCAMSSPA